MEISMSEPEPLKGFYVVTATSVYYVEESGPWRAKATKIALEGHSQVPIGADIAEGGMIAVGHKLISYIPEKYGVTHPMSGYERNPMQINTRYWRWESSPIVALFTDEDSAMACFEEKDKEDCDLRWTDSTRQVLSEIGDEHPSFYVFHDRHYSLTEKRDLAGA